MNRIKWTPWKVCLVLVVGWLILLIVFSPGRICEPLLSTRCTQQAWSFIGDAIWLRDISNWQTLFAGVLALVAALIGTWFINQQITLADKQERERWRRALASARSVLPLTLSALSNYSSECAIALKQMRDACDGERLPRGAPVPVFPSAPLTVASAMQRFIEVSEEDFGHYFSDILSELQVLDARIRTLQADIARHAITARILEDMILQAGRLHALASCAFDYARRDSESLGTVEEIASQYRSSLRLLGFRGDDYERLFQTAERRADRLRANAAD